MFRHIRPSSSQSHDTKESSSAPSNRTANTDAPDDQPQTSSPSKGLTGKARRRRTPSHVSQNACTTCKKARAKCDGSEPTPCTRCVTRGMTNECHYEVHVKTVKEELIRKIKKLEKDNSRLKRSNNQLKGDLAQLKGTILERERFVTNLLKKGDDSQATAILKEAELAFQNLIETPSKLSAQRKMSCSSESLNSLESKPTYGSDVDMESEEDSMPQRWTSVVTDDALVDHLMALYFTWIHPVHMLFGEAQFVSSYRAKNRTYCTPSLVNAICAMGCCFLTDEEGNSEEALKISQQFTRQVDIDMKSEDNMTPASVVAYAVMFLVELSAGKARTAASHLRLAVDSLHEVDRLTWTEEAFEMTSCGIHTLSTVWAALTYQKPTAPVHPNAVVFKNVQLDRPDSFWRAHKSPRDAGKFERPSYAIQTAKEFAKLSQIIHKTITEWCSAHEKVTAKTILGLHRDYHLWTGNLPDFLSNPESYTGTDAEPLAHAFSIHIHQSVALCQLFSPLLDFPGFPPSARNHVRTIVTQAVQNGLMTYRRYRMLFTNRYQPPFLAFSLVHLSDLLLRHGPRSEVNQVVMFCLEALSEALPGFPFVAPLQAMFCESVLSCGHTLPSHVESMMGGRSLRSFSREEKLDCCERLSYKQPADMLNERLDPEVGLRFMEEWKAFIDVHGADDELDAPRFGESNEDQSMQSGPSQDYKSGGSNSAMNISSLMNPLIRDGAESSR